MYYVDIHKKVLYFSMYYVDVALDHVMVIDIHNIFAFGQTKQNKKKPTKIKFIVVFGTSGWIQVIHEGHYF